MARREVAWQSSWEGAGLSLQAHPLFSSAGRAIGRPGFDPGRCVSASPTSQRPPRSSCSSPPLHPRALSRARATDHLLRATADRDACRNSRELPLDACVPARTLTSPRHRSLDLACLCAMPSTHVARAPRPAPPHRGRPFFFFPLPYSLLLPPSFSLLPLSGCSSPRRRSPGIPSFLRKNCAKQAATAIKNPLLRARRNITVPYGTSRLQELVPLTRRQPSRATQRCVPGS